MGCTVEELRSLWHRAIGKITHSYRIPIRGETMVKVCEDTAQAKGTVGIHTLAGLSFTGTETPPKDQQELDMIERHYQITIGPIDQIYLHPDDYSIYNNSLGVGLTTPLSIPYISFPLYIPSKNVIIDDLGGPEPVKPVCECGSSKCGSPSHSIWCPLFVRP